MGDLQQDAYPVARLARRVFSRAMFQFLNNGKGIAHDCVRCFSVNIHNSPDAAGIVFDGLSLSLLIHKGFLRYFPLSP